MYTATLTTELRVWADETGSYYGRYYEPSKIDTERCTRKAREGPIRPVQKDRIAYDDSNFAAL